MRLTRRRGRTEEGCGSSPLNKIISSYYRNSNILPIGKLKKDLDSKNVPALKYVVYLIKHLLQVKGVNDLLRDIALIPQGGNESKRIYRNSMMQFHAIYFVHKTLHLYVLEVESNSNKILSPYRKGDKSCDIKARDSKHDYYFEAKDSSAEIISEHENNGAVFFTPMDGENEIEKWIMRQTLAADRKGANYLICRVDVWGVTPSKRESLVEWIDSIFGEHFIIGNKDNLHQIVVSPKCQLSHHFKGIYVISQTFDEIDCVSGYLKFITNGHLPEPL